MSYGTMPALDEFSGGPESNRFLKSRGFKVVKCGCGGHPAEPNRVRARPTREIRESIERHSERCPECKTRVRELLERIYGTCLRNHRFPWPAHLCHCEGTFIFPALRNVATTLEECRSFGLDDFMRADARGEPVLVEIAYGNEPERPAPAHRSFIAVRARSGRRVRDGARGRTPRRTCGARRAAGFR